MDPLTISALIMGGASIAKGIGQASRAKKLRSEYDTAMGQIPPQDPMALAYLGDTRRRRRAFEAGTDPIASYTREQILGHGAQTQANAVRSGRNQVGDLMRIQAGTNRALADVGARSSAQAERLFGLEGDLVNMMESRAYNRQLSDANRMWSEYARAKEDSNRAIQAGLGMAVAPLQYGAPKRTVDSVAGTSASPSMSDLNLATITDSYGNTPGQAPWWTSQ